VLNKKFLFENRRRLWVFEFTSHFSLQNFQLNKIKMDLSDESRENESTHVQFNGVRTSRGSFVGPKVFGKFNDIKKQHSCLSLGDCSYRELEKKIQSDVSLSE
jgi:hypothetical protein